MRQDFWGWLTSADATGVSYTRRRRRPTGTLVLAEVQCLESRVLLSATWSGVGDGSNWNNPQNWSNGQLPTAEDDVVINVNADTVIVITGIPATVKSLSATGRLNVEGSLVSDGTVDVTGGITLSGTIQGASINGTTLVKVDGSGSLNGVTVNGNLDLSILNSNLKITNGLILNGTATLGESARLYFNGGSQTLGGTGTVEFLDFNYNALIANATGMTLTIDTGITIRGGSGYAFGATIGFNTFWGGGNNTSIVNLGTIVSDVVGNAIRVTPNGTGTLTNTGTISTATGDLILNGSFTRLMLGTLQRRGGSLILRGTLDNSGNNLALSGPAETWTLEGGTIRNGSINLANGAQLSLTNQGGTLDGVTVNGDLALTASGSFFNVLNGLTLNGTALLGESARIYFNGGSQTLNGAGRIEFIGDNFYNALVCNAAGMTLTIGPSMTIRGGSSFQFGATIGFSPFWGGAADSSILNLGTIESSSPGSAIRVFPNGTGNLRNSGVIDLSVGDLVLRGLFTRDMLGMVNRGQGTIFLEGTLDNTGNGLTLTAPTDRWVLRGGTILGGTVTILNGSTFGLTNAGGTLNGVTVNGDLNLIAENTQVNILNGLTLNGTATLGHGGRFYFNGGSQTLGGTGTIQFLPNAFNALIANAAGMTLTIASGMTIRGGSNSPTGGTIGFNAFHGGGGNTSIVNQGTIVADTVGGRIQVDPNGTGTATNAGTLISQNGGILDWDTSLLLTDATAVSIASESTFRVAGNLSIAATSVSQANLAGRIIFDGSGTAANPQTFELRSRNLGISPDAFLENAAVSALELIGNTYVKLMDQVDNSIGDQSEVLYATTVIVPAGAKLDLNGLTVYARAVQLDGVVLNGTILQIPDSGQLTLGVPVPASIGTAGELDEWLLSGTTGELLTIEVNPGSSGRIPPASPQVNWIQVELLDANNTPLAIANAAVAGNTVTLEGIELPSDGLYRIRVNAPTGHAASVGNYTITAWDTTPRVRPLVLNQSETSALLTPYSLDQWAFTAAAGQQIQFDFLDASQPGFTFSLSGPQGQSVFAGLTTDSALLLLPADGEYVLSVNSPTGVTGSYAFRVSQTSVTDLALNVGHTGMLIGDGQPQLYRFTVPKPEVLSILLSDLATSGRTELYARFEVAPTREIFDYAATGPGRSQEISISSAVPGTWYILVYGASIPSPGDFALQVNASDIKINSSYPEHAGNSTPIVMTVEGAGFQTGTSVELVGSSGMPVSPVEFSLDSFTQLTATFPAGIPAGSYALRVRNGSFVDLRPDALTITTSGIANLETRLIVPPALGRHAFSTLYVEYANTGDVPMPAPLIAVQSADDDGSDRPIFTLDASRIIENFWATGLPPGTTNTAFLLGSGRQAGILNPGERITVPVYYLGLLQPYDLDDKTIELEIRFWTESDSTSVDWDVQNESLRPASLSAQQWNAVYGNLTDELPSIGAYVRMLNQNARYLGQLGEHVTSVDDLWNFEIQQAIGFTAVPTLDSVVDASMPALGISLSLSRSYSNSIAAHYETGPFGLGWSTVWQTKLLHLDGDDLIQIVSPEGSGHIFQRDTRDGHYFAGAGDSASLVSIENGAFELRNVSGEVIRFLPNGQIHSMSDANQNRVTATYENNRLVKLTHTSGSWIDIGYGVDELIQSVTDSAGRQSVYTYDASRTYLTQMTTADGRVTRYQYQTTGAPQVLHALLSIERAGTIEYFNYDERGRLDDSYLSGNIQRIDFEYDDTGVVTVDIDPTTPGAAQLYFNEHGQVMKLVDPLGNISTNQYDTNFRLAKAISPTGESQSFTWCNCGSMTSVTNELGQTTTFAYDYVAGNSLKRMTSYTDAKGNRTRYTYDAFGNLLQTIYADGSIEQNLNYQSNGLAQTLVNRRGQAVSVTYDLSGRMTSETFADGSSISYQFDPRGNLIQITDGPDVTVYHYDTAMSGDRVVRVDYPNGQFLVYGYDDFGRRVSMADQDGFKTVYDYDSASRLSRVRDAAGVTLSKYEYDSAGRLQRIEKENGTSTTYEYDAAGQLLSLKNWQNAEILNSRFDYTYDSRGRRISQVTLDGRWDYTYDGVGKLTEAHFEPSGTSTLAAQDLLYVYDAVGNRIRTIINGVTTVYTSNNLNQYTSIGGTAQQYDLDGNLVFDGANTFEYDQLNRLIRMNGPDGVTEYEYDAIGNRTSSTTNGLRTQFLNDASGLSVVLAEYDGQGQVQARNVYGAGLIGRFVGGNHYYFDFDAVGNTADVTFNQGMAVNRYAYVPFGHPILASETIQNPFRLSGQYGVMDANTGDLTFMRARVYNASSGSFLSSDPLGIRSGAVALYSYADNNPITFVDPLGLQSSHGFWQKDPYYGSNGSSNTSGAGQAGGSVRGLASGQCPSAVAHKQQISSSFTQIGYLGGILAGAVFDLAFVVYIPPLKVSVGIYSEVIGGIFGSFIGAAIGDFVGDIVGYFDCPNGVFPVRSPHVRGGNIGNGGRIVNGEGEDPNAKTAATGFGVQGYVSESNVIPYRVDFENDAAATAPAQTVTVSDFLSADLDWSTFRLMDFGFGDHYFLVPPDSQTYRTTVMANYNGKIFRVIVDLGIRIATGEVYAKFQSLDADSELPPDVLTGFLPPEDGTGRGQGHLTYQILPRVGLATGTEIRNIATIVFDQQLGIRTDQVDPHDASQGIDPAKQALVTIDGGIPESSASPLSAISTRTFTLQWAGTDDLNGSGIESFDVYVSDNAGPYLLYLAQSSETSKSFTGLAGHQYAFYTVARDHVGHIEAAPMTADAVTTIEANKPPVVNRQSFEIAENSVVNTVIGTVIASDPDAEDVLTYGIVGGNELGMVAIDPATGVISVMNPSEWDFETRPQFQVTVRVSDQDGLSSENSLSITLIDMNEAPTLTVPVVPVLQEDTPSGPYSFLIGDPEGLAGNLTVFASSSNGGLISDSGLTLLGNDNNRTLSMTPNSDASGATTITITVSDGALTTTKSFEVIVNAVDDPVSILLNPNSLSYRIATRAPVSVDSTAIVTDVDTPSPSLAGNVLHISGQRPKDQLTILKTAGISRKGKNVVVNGIAMGTVAGGKRGSPLLIQLNAAATQAGVQTLVRAVGFKAKGKEVGARTIQFEIRNGNGVVQSRNSRRIEVSQ